jgi:hypothetical protein
MGPEKFHTSLLVEELKVPSSAPMLPPILRVVWLAE